MGGDIPSMPQLGAGEPLFPPPVDGLAVAGAGGWKNTVFWGEKTHRCYSDVERSASPGSGVVLHCGGREVVSSD